MFFDRMMYNGKPAGLVTAVDGATHHAMTALRDGIVTRGVLLDIPALRGVDYLLPGDAVYPDDLDAAAARQGVTVGRGDVVLLRTGNGHRRAPEADAAGPLAAISGVASDVPAVVVRTRSRRHRS